MAAGAASPACFIALALTGALAALPSQAQDFPRGYLDASQVQAIADRVPPPPAEGTEVHAADLALSEHYRAYEGGDRWRLATAHAVLSPRMASQHFDCALGVRFASAPTPRLTALFDQLLKDANGAAETAKLRAFRPRPVGADPERAACTTLTPASRASASYPSGSAAVGVALGEAVAALDPERAEAAREIGHQIAVSRMVCGMHYAADVAAGEAVGRAAFAEAAATPAFTADLEAARAELAAVRATGLTNPGCAAEAAALAQPLP
jgi:acid phosphatase (class A)